VPTEHWITLSCGHGQRVPDALASVTLRHGEWVHQRNGQSYKVRGVGAKVACEDCREADPQGFIMRWVASEEFRRVEERK
jgi:hypothetical protein